MKTITFYVMALLCFITSQLNAQETFEEKVKQISNNIENITKQEKDSLKIEIQKINDQLENDQITNQEAETAKKELAEKRAKNIETRVAAEEEKLSQVLRDKVDGKLKSDSGNKKFSFTFNYDSDADSINKKERVYKRTTSQFVIAGGINRLMTDGDFSDDFKGSSDFYEWGFTYNTRIMKNNNLLHAKYGLSIQYNNLRPKSNQFFVTEDKQTVLATHENNLKLSRFRYVNLVIPVHLEFDFTPKQVVGDRTYFKTHDSFRIGIGGYAGLNVKSKQILKYEIDDKKIKDRSRGDYNVNDFVYGLSAYVGYGEISIYAKYDLQTVFENNITDQNNFSLGLRFDIN